MNIRTQTIRMLSDQLTPVSTFLKLRDITEAPCLLESNDYQSYENSLSIVGFDPLIEILAFRERLIVRKGGREESIAFCEEASLPDQLDRIRLSIKNSGENFKVNGFFGHTSFEAVRYFDDVKIRTESDDLKIPDVHYFFYRYLVVFDHYHHRMTLVENIPEGSISGIRRIKKLLLTGYFEEKPFSKTGESRSNLTDEDFKKMVGIGKEHCQAGDVFQIVLSRRFQQSFSGDDFTVYRALRSVNPSPYLYYFDFGDYRIFGSSPESQLMVNDGMARVNPIAGTYRRTGNDTEDRERAVELSEDQKEVAEHTMLVDLARNDLGRYSDNIRVESLMEVQYFSHVIHLVSSVCGSLPVRYNPFQVFGGTFPAGTLSGAPKIKAMELINLYEHTARGPYGGSIGFFGLDGSIIQAIIIRSFISQDDVLYSQAGAGITINSSEENELQEVNNKLAALDKALSEAEKTVLL